MIDRIIAAAAYRAAGWTFEGDVPRVKKYVALALPHTSNWDGLLLVLVTRKLGLPMAWMVKGDWTRGALGPIVRATGAIGIDRSKANNVVDQMVAEFARRDELALFIPPEGTRKRVDYWKSGFYHIARSANVPIVPGYLDYAHRRTGLGPPIYPTGDVRADMDRIRAFYAEHNPAPLVPADFGPIRLREEDAG